MANADTPSGLKPVGDISGAPYCGAIRKFYVPSSDGTAIYVGGLVKPAGSADADGVMSVTGNVSTGNPVIGVVVGVAPVTADSLIYRAASTERYVYVACGPNLLCEVQHDGTMTATMVGNVADLTGFTSGSTTTGLSSIEISTSTVSAAGDGTEDVMILGAVVRPNNEVGEFAKCIVRLNNHFLVDGSAGA